jgi:hypothetical protein
LADLRWLGSGGVLRLSLFSAQVVRVDVITVESALAWLRGEIDDGEVIPGSGAVFWRELENRSEYRECLAAIAAAKANGAKVMIGRACSEVVSHKFWREGGTPMLNEPRNYRGEQITATRWALTPEKFEAWTNKFCENSKIQFPAGHHR